MGDEVVWRCLAPSNLTIAVNAIRASFPRGTAVIWYNEATPPLVSDEDSCGNRGLGYAVPAGLDWFSTDLYHEGGIEPGWVEATVRAFYDARVFPRLAPGQRVALVPGAFGTLHFNPASPAAASASSGATTAAVCDLACQDSMCAYDAADFAAWAAADPRVVAVLPWDWGGCAGCTDSELGAEVLPLTAAAWAGIGAAIASGCLPVGTASCSPLPSHRPGPSPGPSPGPAGSGAPALPAAVIVGLAVALVFLAFIAVLVVAQRCRGLHHPQGRGGQPQQQPHAVSLPPRSLPAGHAWAAAVQGGRGPGPLTQMPPPRQHQQVAPAQSLQFYRAGPVPAAAFSGPQW